MSQPTAPETLRTRILDLIRSSGPASYLVVAHDLAISQDQACTLLSKMRGEGSIRRIGDARPAMYECNNGEPQGKLPRNWREREALACIARCGAADYTMLMGRLSISRQHATTLLARLSARGSVARTPGSRPHVYRIATEIRE